MVALLLLMALPVTSKTPLLLPATDDAGCDGDCDGEVFVFSLFADGGDIDNLLIFLCKV
jgi:hypothetical protein